MKGSLILCFVVIVLIILVNTVQQGDTFALSLLNGKKTPRRKMTSGRSRISSAKLAKLEKVLRRKFLLKSRLHSLNKFVKKYEAKVRSSFLHRFV